MKYEALRAEIPPSSRSSICSRTASRSNLHLGHPREAALAAWAPRRTARGPLLHVAQGTKEGIVSCEEFFEDTHRLELPDSAPVVSDEAPAPGVIHTIEGCHPFPVRQGCLVHKLENRVSSPSGCSYLRPLVKSNSLIGIQPRGTLFQQL